MIQKRAYTITVNISKLSCFTVIIMLFFSSFLGFSVVSDDMDIGCDRASFVSNELIIKFKDDIDSFFSFDDLFDTGVSSLDSLNAKHDVVSQERLFVSSDFLSNYYKFKFSDCDDLSSLIEDYSSLDFVEFVEPNYVYNICKVPDDPLFGSQWGLDQSNDCDIDAPEAWDIGTGSNDVVIAVVDTGVDYDHEDLVGKCISGYDFVNNDNDPMDDHNHGTHCAGIIGANGNNGVGISGVCWNCKIMPVKVLSGQGSGSSSGVAQGIEYAADNGADVISMSLGGSQTSQVIKDAVNHAYSKGVVLIAAAGNDDSSTKMYPAAYDNVIAVAATNKDDDRAYFSQYGSWVDVAAPGKNIKSCVIGDEYESFSGTSMACPHVSGLAGLILSKKSDLSVDEVKSIIRSTTDETNSNEPIGTGRINAYEALKSFLNLEYSPKSYDFGDMYKDQTDSASFEIWNNASEEMDYTLSEDCGWISISPTQGSSSSGKRNTINVDVDTSGLDYNSYTCNIEIESDDGTYVFEVSVNVVSRPPDNPSDPMPSVGAMGVGVNPTFLGVNVSDPDLDSMSVSFFDNVGDVLIDSVRNIQSGETAVVEWSGLDFATTYSWYVVVNDSLVETKSSVFSFTTNSPPVLSNVYPENGSADVSLGLGSVGLDIVDPDGDSVDWSITTVPDVGSSYIGDDLSGGKFCNVSGLLPDTSYSWVVTAVDSMGAKVESVFSFKTRENMAPGEPVAVYPLNSGVDVGIICTLNWSCVDPDGDTDLVYDVYLGNSGSPSLLKVGVTDSFIVVPYDLELSTRYYWKIVATDRFETSSESDVFSFTTSSIPPPPRPGSLEVSFPRKICWSGIKTSVLNKGSRDASNVLWDVSVSGGVIDRLDMSMSGCIERLDSGESQDISTHAFLDFSSKRVLGLGRVEIMVKTSNVLGEVIDSSVKDAFVFGPVVLLLD